MSIFQNNAGYSGCFGNSLTVENPSRNCLSPNPLAGDPNNGYQPPALEQIMNVFTPDKKIKKYCSTITFR